jgi:hypothetical protein
MRDDHVFYLRLGDALPSHEEIEQSMARARRMRSEVFHELLARAVARIGEALRPARSPKALQGC